jgi:energy-coupling factor transporter ATP-binding protein EcfA2
MLFWILLALGSPVVFRVAYNTTEHWWQVVGILLIYGLAVVLFGFPTKVWEKLADRWAGRVAESLDHSITRLLSGFDRKYRRHIIQRNRYFDVKGLSTQGIHTLELNQVFVDLKISPRKHLQSSADIIPEVTEEMKKGQSIWAYLTSEQLKDRHLVIIGPPGSGKTTLLQHMALTLAAGRKARRKAGAPAKTPIVLYLRNHAEAINKKPELTLSQAVRDHLKAWELEAPPRWFRKHLKQGHCIVMLDGLDEVADPKARKKVVDWVQRQMEAYPRNRFVVTSRPYGYYKQTLNGAVVLEVSPFSQGQVKRFVHNWYLANEIMSKQLDDEGVRLDARKGAEDLLRRLNTSDLAALAVNPLLLTMIATVHRYKSSLPKRRVELYKEICEVFLGQRRQARDLELDLTPAQNQRVLQPLAFHLMREEQREIKTELAVDVIADSLRRVSPTKKGKDFLKEVEQESGLLLERENGVLSFAHKTFQEYLASVHILEQDYGHVLAAQVENDWWHETIRLYAAQTDASGILEACLQEDPPSIPALTLAIECSEEALELRPEIREQLDDVLTEGVEGPDEERRRIIAEALLALRLRRLTRIDEDRFIDNSLITHAEYQLFLDEMRADGKYFQPDHWSELRFPEGKGREPVVGVRPSDAEAFCRWLTERNGGDWQYRSSTNSEADLPVEETTDLEPLGFWYALKPGHSCRIFIGQIPPLTVDMLEAQIDSDINRIRALDLLNNIPNDLDYVLCRSRILKSELDDALSISSAFNLELAHGHNDCARAFDLDLVRAINLDRILHHTLDLSYELDSTSDLYYARTDALAHPLARTLNFDLARTAFLNPARDLCLGLKHTLEITRTLNINLSGVRPLARTPDRNLVELGQLLFRIDIYLVSETIYLLLNSIELSRPLTQRLTFNREHRSLENKLENIAKEYLEIYVDLAILEARKRGELPAFEGIRIVKERVSEDNDLVQK